MLQARFSKNVKQFFQHITSIFHNAWAVNDVYSKFEARKDRLVSTSARNKQNYGQLAAVKVKLILFWRKTTKVIKEVIHKINGAPFARFSDWNCCVITALIRNLSSLHARSYHGRVWTSLIRVTSVCAYSYAISHTLFKAKPSKSLEKARLIARVSTEYIWMFCSAISFTNKEDCT